MLPSPPSSPGSTEPVPLLPSQVIRPHHPYGLQGGVGTISLLFPSNPKFHTPETLLQLSLMPVFPLKHSSLFHLSCAGPRGCCQVTSLSEQGQFY